MFLDGQQRLTSIFSTFQTELKQNPNTKVNWTDIYFDLDASPNAQDSQFVALEPTEVRKQHVPLRVLFDVAEFGKLIRTITNEAQLKRVDQLQALFKEALIPVETVETEEHSKIAIIFERINRGGVPLDTYQLLSAWTWSGDFDLRTKFDELSNELDEVGYNELREDPDLLLKCCAAVVRNDASARAIIDLKGSEVRDSFDVLRNGVLGAIDFLRRDCGVASLKVLPYKSMIIPLTRCFATDKDAGFHPTRTKGELFAIGFGIVASRGGIRTAWILRFHKILLQVSNCSPATPPISTSAASRLTLVTLQTTHFCSLP